jgi:hypothetical protein
MQLKILLLALRFTSVFVSCLILTIAPASVTLACVVCVPLPTKTVADYIVESNAVVLARENPDKPFSYLAVENIKGMISNPEIDLFINSSTRRRLSMNKQSAVALAQDTAGNWRSLGYADEDYERIIRETVLKYRDWEDNSSDWGGNSADWEGHSTYWENTSIDSLNRIAFFAPLLGHSNHRIHELAYIEVGRAPYSLIREFSLSWPADKVRMTLNDPLKFEWFPLAILILGLNAENIDQQLIRESFTNVSGIRSSINLAAWTTAYIEIDGEAALDEIEKLYFQSTNRDLDELIAVTTAMSVHGTNGHIYLRDRIVQSYITLIDNYPAMVSYVARDLSNWEEWSLVSKLRKLLNEWEGQDPVSTYSIRIYLGKAENG